MPCYKGCSITENRWMTVRNRAHKDYFSTWSAKWLRCLSHRNNFWKPRTNDSALSVHSQYLTSVTTEDIVGEISFKVLLQRAKEMEVRVKWKFWLYGSNRTIRSAPRYVATPAGWSRALLYKRIPWSVSMLRCVLQMDAFECCSVVQYLLKTLDK